MSKGNFFALGSAEFVAACELGMNPAVALLVMARGTGRDNATTAWSALSVFNHSGMARRRAQEAIAKLQGAGLIDVLQSGKKPRYKLHKPTEEDKLLWLPNALIDGAGNETPPIARLRETGNLALLEKFVGLYGLQDLDSDGGLPRSIVWSHFEREEICPIGPFTFYGFSSEQIRAKSIGLFKDLHGQEDEDGNEGAWTVLKPLWTMGLIEHVHYMAESTDPDAELIYPVGPYGTAEAIDELISWLEEADGKGFATEAMCHSLQGVAPKHIKKAAVVGVFRLKYRPWTGKTSRWFALEMERAEAMVGIIRQICNEKTASVHIKAVQGF
ncbi:hypothetical protein [Celeribacter sp.]|uniref:hypothetical protein n=1 Tax=Celeribacter sp. TaxID=1890673 RepID=UPI003A95849A